MISKPVTDYKVLDVDVAIANIKGYDPEQNIIICDLLDANDSVLASDRYYQLGEQPFDLTEDDLNMLEPDEPDLPSEPEDEGSENG